MHPFVFHIKNPLKNSRTLCRQQNPYMPFAADMLTAGPAAWWMLMVLAFFWGLILCLAGYVLYRIYIVFGGLQAGVVIGAVVVERWFDQPGGVDFFIVCACLAVLLAMAAWFMDRLMFAGIVLSLTAVTAWALVAGGADTWVGVLLGFSGLVAAVLTFVYLKPIFIVVSALTGAATAVASSFCLLTNRLPAKAEPLFSPGAATDLSWTTVCVLLALTVALTTVGVIVQRKLSRYVRTRFLPNDDKNKPKRKTQGTRSSV